MTPDQRAAHKRARQFSTACPSGSPVLAWPGTRDQEPLRTRTRHSAWVLASGEPVVSVVGYAGGIHLDHIEPDPTRQPAVPDVEFEMPPCPICGEGLDSDGDSLTCNDGCRATWATNGTGGTWDDPAATRCPSVARLYLTLDNDSTERCCLDLHHPGDHRSLDGLSSWSDRSPQVVVDGEGRAA